jgi:uncharacterized membrane protein YcaP (DUF421 family)
MELDLTGIIFRVSLMYVYALTLVRISGKQSIGQLAAMDLVVTLIIGDLFDDVFWAEVPLVQGLVGFGTVVLAHILVTYLSSRSKLIDQLVNSSPRLLIQNGKLVQEGLQREWMRQETLQVELRLKGEEHPREIREARLEPDGQTSVIKVDANKPVQKKDMPRLHR